MPVDNKLLESVSAMLGLANDGLVPEKDKDGKETGRVMLKRTFVSEAAANEADAALEQVDWTIGKDLRNKSLVVRQPDGTYAIILHRFDNESGPFGINTESWKRTRQDQIDSANVQPRLSAAFVADDGAREAMKEKFNALKSSSSLPKEFALADDGTVNFKFNSEAEATRFKNEITYLRTESGAGVHGGGSSPVHDYFADVVKIDGEYRVKINAVKLYQGELTAETIAGRVAKYESDLSKRLETQQSNADYILAQLNNGLADEQKLTLKRDGRGNATIVAPDGYNLNPADLATKLNGIIGGLARVKDGEVVLDDLVFRYQNNAKSSLTAEQIASLKRSLVLTETQPADALAAANVPAPTPTPTQPPAAGTPPTTAATPTGTTPGAAAATGTSTTSTTGVQPPAADPNKPKTDGEKSKEEEKGNPISNNMFGMMGGLGSLILFMMMGFDPLIAGIIALVIGIAANIFGDEKGAMAKFIPGMSGPSKGNSPAQGLSIERAMADGKIEQQEYSQLIGGDKTKGQQAEVLKKLCDGYKIFIPHRNGDDIGPVILAKEKDGQLSDVRITLKTNMGEMNVKLDGTFKADEFDKIVDAAKKQTIGLDNQTALTDDIRSGLNAAAQREQQAAAQAANR